MLKCLPIADILHTILYSVNIILCHCYKINSPGNISRVFFVPSILAYTHILFSIQYNVRCMLWNHIYIFVYHIIVYNSEVFQSHSFSTFWIILTFRTILCNWTWNMCAMINWSTLIKNIYTDLRLCHYLYSPAIWNQRTPSICSQTWY